jgi:hypothetical protein
VGEKMSNNSEIAPRKVRLTLNIGVTGHRSLKDADIESIKNNIFQVLRYIKHTTFAKYEEVKDLYRKEVPKFRLISPLAEGSDRIAAKCALEKGYELQCPIPFTREEYEKDFITEESKLEFKELIDKAESVFEIEYNSGSRSKAYLNVGQIVLGHSDLLIAIWNGKEPEFMGGTSDIVEQAIKQEIPVIWIRSYEPYDIVFIRGEKRLEGWKEEISNQLNGILLPRGEEKKFNNKSLLREYFGEKQPKRNFAFLYNMVTNCIASKGNKNINIKVENNMEATEKEWDTVWQNTRGLSKKCINFINDSFLAHYAWADKLSVYYADYFRTAGILRQLLPFFATVGLAIGFYWGWGKSSIINALGFALQGLFLALIIVLSNVNKKNKWHQRYADYRVLAESIKQMMFLTPLGIGMRGIREPVYNRNAKISWVNWHIRGIIRENGLPNFLLDSNSLKACKQLLKNSIVQSQIEYHRKNSDKLSLISNRLERFGLSFYYVGLMVTILRVFVYFINQAYSGTTFLFLGIPLTTFVNMLTLAIPVFASTAFGISAQGGFERLMYRSSSMAEKLQEVAESFDMVEGNSYTEVKGLAERTADIMISEFTDWRMFLESKSVSNH